MNARAFGDLLATGLDCLVARQRPKGMMKGGLELEIAQDLAVGQALVQKWQRTHLPVGPQHVEYLIIRCKREGRMEREWAEDLLRAYGKHPGSLDFLDGIYGESAAEFTKLMNMAEFNNNRIRIVEATADVRKKGLGDRPKGQFNPAYHQGKPIQIKITTEKDENLLLLDKDADGKIFCLSPSPFVPEAKLNQGENTLPKEQSRRSAFYINSRPGREHLLAILTEEPLPDVVWKLEDSEAVAPILKDRKLRPIVRWCRDLPYNRREIFETSFEVLA